MTLGQDIRGTPPRFSKPILACAAVLFAGISFRRRTM